MNLDIETLERVKHALIKRNFNNAKLISRALADIDSQYRPLREEIEIIDAIIKDIPEYKKLVLKITEM